MSGYHSRDSHEIDLRAAAPVPKILDAEAQERQLLLTGWRITYVGSVHACGKAAGDSSE